jgi:hypothetical protein
MGRYGPRWLSEVKTGTPVKNRNEKGRARAALYLSMSSL